MHFSSIGSTLANSVEYLRQGSWGIRARAAWDFAMQAQPVWILYAAYTAVRYVGLTARSLATPKERYVEVWKEWQLYSSMRVTGLLVSQAALFALGLGTWTAAACALAYGGVVLAVGCHADYEATKKEEPIRKIE